MPDETLAQTALKAAAQTHASSQGYNKPYDTLQTAANYLRFLRSNPDEDPR